MFEIISPFSLSVSQKESVNALVSGVKDKGYEIQTLKGVTGCGKTFIMANIIKELGRPALILSHNKTLAAQLYREMKGFLPNNAVEYFVSTYDYYQPEAYIPGKDLYIEKEVDLNDEIDRLRMHASFSLLERKDVVVVSTVSCIYGLGSPEALSNMVYVFIKGTVWDSKKILRTLVSMQYKSTNAEITHGTFSSHGDLFYLMPGYEEHIVEIELDFDEVASIRILHPITREVLDEVDEYILYPAKQFVMPESSIHAGVVRIKDELKERLEFFLDRGKPVEYERLKTRVEYDIDMLQEIGYCSGIENYSRPLTGRLPGSRPSVLLDYFPPNFVTFIDESHVTLSQVGAMYEGDRSRKQNLVDYGFRLPSALDNRPLKFSEFEQMIGTRIYVSATPGDKEKNESSQTVEQIIRPTGLLDPSVEVRGTTNQIDDIKNEIEGVIKNNERVLITTLTKKMAENLSEFFKAKGFKVAYLHSEIETIERVKILKGLRTGEYDVLIGINLLREGLDLPEVSLIVILDADKVGFLRSATSLIQIIGRAARNEHGRVIMYADVISPSMKEAIDETQRRRNLQMQYNKEHNIVPHTIKKEIKDILESTEKKKSSKSKDSVDDLKYNPLDPASREKYIKNLEKEMKKASNDYDFEKAIALREEIKKLKGRA